MKTSLFLAAALLLTGCYGPDAKKTSDQNIQSMKSNISYFMDSRTGLCFAAVSSRGYGNTYTESISNVPCNEEVLALVK